MAVGRKGVFFTLMALLLVAFLFTYQGIISPQQSLTRMKSDAATARISLLNNYLGVFEQHAADSLATAGYFTLQNLSDRVGAKGEFIKDMNASVDYCMSNITNPYNCMGKNHTINHTLDKLAVLAKDELSITTAYRINKVWVTEENPFEIVFWMNISYNVTDSFASWRMERIVRAQVDVTGITDPAYAYEVANGNLTVPRPFNPTVYKRFEFTNTTFTSYYNNRSYLLSATRGPSVMQRYTGQLYNSSVCCGIESVIRYDELPASLAMPGNPRLMNWSFVDYQFFLHNDTRYNFDCAGTGIWSLRQPDFPEKYVRLDTDHTWNVYQVNGSAYRGCNP